MNGRSATENTPTPPQLRPADRSRSLRLGASIETAHGDIQLEEDRRDQQGPSAASCREFTSKSPVQLAGVGGVEVQCYRDLVIWQSSWKRCCDRQMSYLNTGKARQTNVDVELLFMLLPGEVLHDLRQICGLVERFRKPRRGRSRRRKRCRCRRREPLPRSFEEDAFLGQKSRKVSKVTKSIPSDPWLTRQNDHWRSENCERINK